MKGARRVEKIGGHTLYLGDCVEIMEGFGPKEFDAVVTDPPYGLGEAAGKNKSRVQLSAAKDYGNSDWDNQPVNQEVVDQILSLSDLQVIFGGNYYSLPPSSCWFVWDKDNNSNDFADCELVWTNLKMAVRKIKYRWNGMLQEDMRNKENRVHPTQKPVPVMVWCLEKIAESKSIMDPFMGSGTTGVACERLGRKFTGIEIDENYFDIACKRIEQEVNQLKMNFEGV